MNVSCLPSVLVSVCRKRGYFKTRRPGLQIGVRLKRGPLSPLGGLSVGDRASGKEPLVPLRTRCLLRYGCPLGGSGPRTGTSSLWVPGRKGDCIDCGKVRECCVCGVRNNCTEGDTLKLMI